MHSAEKPCVSRSSLLRISCGGCFERAEPSASGRPPPRAACPWHARPGAHLHERVKDAVHGKVLHKAVLVDVVGELQGVAAAAVSAAGAADTPQRQAGHVREGLDRPSAALL